MKRVSMAGLALALAATLAGAAHAAPAFDARRAADVAALITAHGASGGLKKSDDGTTYFDGQAGSILFNAHFQACDKPRTLCKTLLLNGAWDSKKITVDQVNRWNRWTLFCPAFIDGDGSPSLWYAIAVSANTAQADLTDDVGTWMECLHDFDSFVSAPEAFLKAHS